MVVEGVCPGKTATPQMLLSTADASVPAGASLKASLKLAVRFHVVSSDPFVANVTLSGSRLPWSGICP
jgi:hypothetical protein